MQSIEGIKQAGLISDILKELGSVRPDTRYEPRTGKRRDTKPRFSRTARKKKAKMAKISRRKNRR